MTVENKNYSDIIPVTLNLADPDRSLDLSIPQEFATQQGLNLLEYNFLLSAYDTKTKNFTTNFLTSKFTEDRIFDLTLPEDTNNSINTTLQFNASADCFLTIDKNFTEASADGFFSVLSTGDFNATQNFVVSLSTAGDGMPVCQIYTYDGIYKKYLVQHTSFDGANVGYDLVFDRLSDSYEARSFFDVIVSGNSIRLSIYGNRSSVLEGLPTRNTSFLIQKIGGALSAVANPGVAAYKESTITINNFNVDYDYYKSSNNFVNYVTGADINPNLTLSGIDYNFLMYNNYEENYLSGEKMVGKINYFNLKNQISNHHNVNKNLNHTNPQTQREYTDIIVNEVEEESEEFLKLNYNFYTAEYNFQPDTITKFVLPESIAPYDRININDAGFQQSGAYAAGSPYFSDRVLKNIDTQREITNEHNERGEYLCSWLYDDGKSGLWYDRFYIPANVNGLSGSGLTPEPLFEVTPEIDSILINFSLSGLNYYDVQSTLMLEPSGTYYYARVGKEYINGVIDSQSDSLLKKNFTPRSIYDKSFIGEESNTLVLTQSSYDTFTFPVDNKGTKNSLHMSFGLTVPDIDKAKSFQLVGNLFNTGIGIQKNFYFTPFIYLQQDNNLFFYDTDFNLIKTSNFPTVTAIKDVMYLNQSNDFILVGDGPGDIPSLRGGRLIRAAYTGDVQKENNDVIVQGLIGSEPTSRVMFNIGSKSTIKSAGSPGNNAWNVDLNSLVADPAGGASASLPAGDTSIIRRVNNTLLGSMSGLRGVNLDDTLGAAISSHHDSTGVYEGNSIIFKDFVTDTTFIALSTDTKIWDINAMDEKLYVQTDNKLKVFNTSRDLLSTFSLTTSAVSGYKIDFITEDYKIMPIVFSRGADTNLIVDKINFDSTAPAGYILSSYSLGISSVDLGYDFTTKPGWFVNPTNLYSIDQTYRNFENRFCLVSRFDNEFAANPEGRIWDTSEQDWETADSGNWSVNYTGGGGVIDDNSTLTVIENIRDGENCLGVDLDLITGKTEVYVNGLKTVDKVITTGIKPLKNYLNNSFYVGLPNYSVDTISDFVRNQDFNTRNITLKDLYVYDKELPNDLIMYHYLNCSTIDPVNFDVISGTRNNIETIDNFFSYKIPGSLSNRIKIYIKNANLTDNNAITLANLITSKINTFLPKNVTTIEYDFSIGNRVETLADDTIVIDIPAIQSSVDTEGDPSFGALSDYITYQDDSPALTQDDLFVYLES